MSLAGLCIIAFGFVPLSAPAVTESCSRDSTAAAGTTVGSDDTVVFAGLPECLGFASCPSSHPGPCTLALRATAQATGLTGVAVSADGAELARCSFTPTSCTAAATKSVAKGDTVPVYCNFIDGAAVDVNVSCTWTIS